MGGGKIGRWVSKCRLDKYIFSTFPPKFQYNRVCFGLNYSISLQRLLISSEVCGIPGWLPQMQRSRAWQGAFDSWGGGWAYSQLPADKMVSSLLLFWRCVAWREILCNTGCWLMSMAGIAQEFASCQGRLHCCWSMWSNNHQRHFLKLCQDSCLHWVNGREWLIKKQALSEARWMSETGSITGEKWTQ